MLGEAALWALFPGAAAVQEQVQLAVGLLACLALCVLALVVPRLPGRPDPVGRLGKVLYADVGSHAFARGDLGLGGRPDFIIRRSGHVVPVELKTGRPPDRPRADHVAQLACYGLLVEGLTVSYPRFGFLIYSRCSRVRYVRVSLGQQARAEAVALVAATRASKEAGGRGIEAELRGRAQRLRARPTALQP